MTAKQISLELRQLRERAKPSAAQWKFVEEQLSSKDSGISLLAARTVATWGGNRALDALRTWINGASQHNRKDPWNWGIAFRDFRRSSYALSVTELKWVFDQVNETQPQTAALSGLQYWLLGMVEVHLMSRAQLEAGLADLVNKSAPSQARAIVEHLGHALSGDFLKWLSATSQNEGLQNAARKTWALLEKWQQARNAAPAPSAFSLHFGKAGDVLVTEPVQGHLGFTLSMVSRKGGKYFLQHALYGPIPLRVIENGGATAFAPAAQGARSVPPGALPAKIDQQNLQNGAKSLTTWEPVFAVPRCFYQDTVFRCVQCRSEAVFTAEEQRKWYETYWLPTYIERNLCFLCDRKRKGIQRLEEVVVALKGEPENTELLLEEAKLRIWNAMQLSQKSLQRATNCLRKVAKARPDFVEILYWQAAVLESAGKPSEAKIAYENYVKKEASANKLVADAKNRIERLGARK
jgi:hypothetical protein